MTLIKKTTILFSLAGAVLAGGLVFFSKPLDSSPQNAFEEILGAGSTTSTYGTAEELLYQGLPTTVMGFTTFLTTGNNGAWVHRCPMRFVIPSGTGTITQVILYQKVKTGGVGTPGNAEVYQLLRTDWVDGEATWNSYKSGSAWTTAGAYGSGTDIGASAIDSATVPAVGAWQSLYLMGGTSDNPLTINWGDTVNLLLRNTQEGGTNYTNYYARTGDADNHYLEITYTLPGGTQQATLIIFE